MLVKPVECYFFSRSNGELAVKFSGANGVGARFELLGEQTIVASKSGYFANCQVNVSGIC
jgi:hypothetical protein